MNDTGKTTRLKNVSYLYRRETNDGSEGILLRVPFLERVVPKIPTCTVHGMVPFDALNRVGET
jgi:hypothetical protein